MYRSKIAHYLPPGRDWLTLCGVGRGSVQASTTDPEQVTCKRCRKKLTLTDSPTSRPPFASGQNHTPRS